MNGWPYGVWSEYVAGDYIISPGSEENQMSELKLYRHRTFARSSRQHTNQSGKRFVGSHIVCEFLHYKLAFVILQDPFKHLVSLEIAIYAILRHYVPCDYNIHKCTHAP